MQRCWDLTSKLWQRGGIHKDDHMAVEVKEKTNVGQGRAVLCCNDRRTACAKIMHI